MNRKNIFVILLIMLVALCFLGAVAGADNTTEKELEDKDVVIDSSVVFYYTTPQKSTDYAYFYEDSGKYASDAYYGPYSFDATFDLSVKKLYKYGKYDKDENYSYKKFQKELKKVIDKNLFQMSIKNYSSINEFDDKIPGVVPLDIPAKNLTTTLSDDGSVLTIGYSYSSEDYGHKDLINLMKHIKSTKDLDFDIDFNTHDCKLINPDDSIDICIGLQLWNTNVTSYEN